MRGKYVPAPGLSDFPALPMLTAPLPLASPRGSGHKHWAAWPRLTIHQGHSRREAGGWHTGLVGGSWEFPRLYPGAILTPNLTLS